MDALVTNIDFKKLHFTPHSIRRAVERLGIERSKVIPHIKGLLKSAQFLKFREDNNSVVFYHKISKTSIILSDDLKRVITVYKSNEKVDDNMSKSEQSRKESGVIEQKEAAAPLTITNHYLIEAVIEKRQAVELEITERMYVLKAKIGRLQAMMFDAKLAQLHETVTSELDRLKEIESNSYLQTKEIRTELQTLEKELKLLNAEAEQLVGKEKAYLKAI
ncbi:hypothetical protein ABD91_21170 [Lysinibacillus sphaericus]|uniref:hypothetical protein n=1 Tax=Lysinibacillus sphaericus TaxID=1421 RepID=UPI0018CDB76B|nr:hypothetical protein [Lysinibacillus sphaericus]MBG9693251.1 hypothetical protein [Lysinibacillus sphaericus]